MNEKTPALLITNALNEAEINAAICELAPRHHLTLLSDRPVKIKEQIKEQLKQEIEIWVARRLGLRGTLALIRRISWSEFTIIYQPQNTLPQNKIFWACLPYLIFPRPQWVQQISS